MSMQYCRDHAGSKTWRWLRGLSIDMSYDFRRWRKHQKAFRNLMLWSPANIVAADNIRRLCFPDLAVIGGVSSLVCYYNRWIAHDPTQALEAANSFWQFGQLALPMECFSITTVALGLLVTFKTQSCYNRFDDARAQWGLIINESRALGSRILTRVPAPEGENDWKVQRAKRHALKLIQTFPHTLKYHLTEDGCNPHIVIREETPDAEIRVATSLALQVELSQIWNMEDEREASIVYRILALEIGNRPMFVLHELSHINSHIFADPTKGALHPVVSTEIDRSLSLFHHTLGRSERILRTPIYTPYTKFTSRFLYFWCSALPLAMYPLLGPIGTTPVTLLVSFFLMGIQDIGSRVEQPFDVLPLWQYCATVDASVEQLLRQAEALDSYDVAGAHLDSVNDFMDIPEEQLESWCDPL